jgi:hypothetical protein
MFNYSDQIKAFRTERVRLTADFREKLLAHRTANRNRLINRLPDFIESITIGESSFRPQGSFAMRTVIQTRFLEEEYDIDDGIVLWRHQLVDENGAELTADQVREKVRDALKDSRFNRQPKICPNCIRVFYADEDQEKHHVDFPIYRRYNDGNGKKVRQLATENGWVASDPTEVNTWFDGEVEARNKQTTGWGTQLRHMIQLVKRLCRSRSDWDLPNGMKLTMLAVECQPNYQDQIDVVFRELLERLKGRLAWNKVILNLADPDNPAITRTGADNNVVELETHLGEALDQLRTLDNSNNNDVDAARTVWDWIFKSDGFFGSFDAEKKKQRRALIEKAAMIGLGARTSPIGVIGSFGIENLAHNFHGEESAD